MITGNTTNYIKKQSEQEDFDFQIQDNFDEEDINDNIEDNNDIIEETDINNTKNNKKFFEEVGNIYKNEFKQSISCFSNVIDSIKLISKTSLFELILVFLFLIIPAILAGCIAFLVVILLFVIWQIYLITKTIYKLFEKVEFSIKDTINNIKIKIKNYKKDGGFFKKLIFSNALYTLLMFNGVMYMIIKGMMLPVKSALDIEKIIANVIAKIEKGITTILKSPSELATANIKSQNLKENRKSKNNKKEILNEKKLKAEIKKLKDKTKLKDKPQQKQEKNNSIGNFLNNISKIFQNFVAKNYNQITNKKNIAQQQTSKIKEEQKEKYDNKSNIEQGKAKNIESAVGTRFNEKNVEKNKDSQKINLESKERRIDTQKQEIINKKSQDLSLKTDKKIEKKRETTTNKKINNLEKIEKPIEKPTEENIINNKNEKLNDIANIIIDSALKTGIDIDMNILDKISDKKISSEEEVYEQVIDSSLERSKTIGEKVNEKANILLDEGKIEEIEKLNPEKEISKEEKFIDTFINKITKSNENKENGGYCISMGCGK